MTHRQRCPFSLYDLVFYTTNMRPPIWGEVLSVSGHLVHVHYFKAHTTYQEERKHLVPSVWSFAGPLPATWKGQHGPR